MRGRGEIAVAGPVYYRINDDNAGPELLLEVCIERGWRSWDLKNGNSRDDGGNAQHWHLWWRHSFPGHFYRRLQRHQIVNHIARANGLCRKDTLARTLYKMRNSFPQAFNFSPPTFLLPGEYTKLVAEYTRLLYQNKASRSTAEVPEEDSSAAMTEGVCHAPMNIWICKPIGSSQGKGIIVFQDLHNLTYGGSAVVQRYLEHPLLVGGYKCDIRLYVLVTSLLPLSIYIYAQGIVRFGTEKYDLDDLDNPFSHLTNTAINKIAPGYKLEKNRIGTGCKWTLTQLRRYLKSIGRRDWLLWHKMNVLVSLTLISQLNESCRLSDYSKPGTCFELYGFDILVDERLTPWLLEVNRCPSLTYDCDVDRIVKKPLLHQLFDLVGPPKVSKKVTHSDFDVVSQRVVSKRRRSSQCEECDVGRGTKMGLRWRRSGWKNSKSISPKVNRLLSALSGCDGNASDSRPKGGRSCLGRRLSFPSFSDTSMAEELNGDVYLTLNHCSSFHSLRKQFLSDKFSSRSSSCGSIASFESIAFAAESRPQHKYLPKCGDWIRTFPFNASTLHGSRNSLYIKNVVAELLKFRRTCEKMFKENPTSDCHELDNQVRKLLWADHVLWSPKMD